MDILEIDYEKCFVCMNDLSISTIYLPNDEEYFGNDISIFKNTFIIKTIDNFSFLYYCICNARTNTIICTCITYTII